MTDLWLKPKGYKGCKNCIHQPEPLKVCDWLKMQKSVAIICPKWEKKGGGTNG